MRPVVILRLVGAFTLYWIVYQTWPVSLVVAIMAIMTWIAVAIRKSSRKKRPAAALPTSGQHTLPPNKSTPRPRKMTMPSLQPSSIMSAIDQLPASITQRSGSLFYSGPSAFKGERPLYILGLNPGGSPIDQAHETVERDIADWRALTKPWSAYLDESWQGKPAGAHGMQPRMRHMFDQLGLDLREVPASNVVFVRSTTEAALSAEKAVLLSKCWHLHAAVLQELNVRTILCLGTTAGRWTRDAIGANKLADRFQEKNGRGWTSEAHTAPDGRVVVTVTHPGRADWRNPAADPTALVRAMLER